MASEKIGGYTLEELLGAAPIGEPEPKKPSLVGRIVAAPFKAIAAVVKVPVRLVDRAVRGLGRLVRGVVTLPFRIVGAVLRPLRRS